MMQFSSSLGHDKASRNLRKHKIPTNSFPYIFFFKFNISFSIANVSFCISFPLDLFMELFSLSARVGAKHENKPNHSLRARIKVLAFSGFEQNQREKCKFLLNQSRW